MSFVLRLWGEPRDFERKQPAWRGSVEEFDGSNTRYFDSTQGLGDILADATGAESLRISKGPVA